MSSHKIAVLENIRSAQIEQQRIETLSSTKLWVGMAAGVTLTGVTTAAIAFTVPAASVICGAAASVLAVAAAVFALVAAGLYVAKEQALFNCLFYVNGHRIADRGQVSILRQISPQAREFIVAQRLFDARDLRWNREQLNHFSQKELQLFLNHFGPAFLELDFEGLAEPMPESIDVVRCLNLKQLGFAGQQSLKAIDGLENCQNLSFLSLRDCQALDEELLLDQLNRVSDAAITIDCHGSNLVVSTADDLRRKFAPGGMWPRFLDRHPSCNLNGLVSPNSPDFMESDCNQILGGEAFHLVPSPGTNVYNVQPLTELVVGKALVTDRAQIKLLLRLSPCQREYVASAGLLDSQSRTLRWNSNNLNKFTPEQIQLLLDCCGHQFSALDFRHYKDADRLTSLDISQCANLETINYSKLMSLTTLTGFEGCPKLREVMLEKCGRLDRNSVLEALLKDQNRALKVRCLRSSLTIMTLEDLKTQLAPDGLWLQFLKTHPSCVVYDFVEDDAWSQRVFQRTCAELVGPCGFRVEASLNSLGSYNVRPAGSKD